MISPLAASLPLTATVNGVVPFCCVPPAAVIERLERQDGGRRAAPRPAGVLRLHQIKQGLVHVVGELAVLEHRQHRQRRRLHGQALAAGVGQRLPGRREVDRLPLRLFLLHGVELLQDAHQHLVRAVVLGVPRRQGVGRQRQDVGVVGVLGVVADIRDRLLQLRRLQAGVQQRPGHIAGQQQFRIAHRGDGLVVGHADLVPGAVGRLLLEEPGLRAVDDAVVHRVDLRHVVELLQAVGADPDQRLVGLLPPPIEAAGLVLERQQPLVAGVEVLLGLHHDGGRLRVRPAEVVHRQHVGVGRRRGLLEAAAGHPQDAVGPFEELAEDAGVDLHQQLRGVGQGVLGDGQRLDDVAAEVVGDGLLDELAVGADFDGALDRVGHLGAVGLDGQGEAARLAGADAEMGGGHFVGLEVEGAASAPGRPRRRTSLPAGSSSFTVCGFLR